MTTLCVTSFLTLVVLGGSDPTSGFRLETLLRPLSNHGARFRYDCHIPRCRARVVRGVKYYFKYIKLYVMIFFINKIYNNNFYFFNHTYHRCRLRVTVTDGTVPNTRAKDKHRIATCHLHGSAVDTQTLIQRPSSRRAEPRHVSSQAQSGPASTISCLVLYSSIILYIF
jgi:hypothetical protein